jgi:hypothetical protein
MQPSTNHRRRFPVVLVAAVAVALHGLGAPPAALASVYNMTNPGNTVCGNGTKPVKTWRAYYVRTTTSTPVTIGLIETRFSRYCNTVWTKITNLTQNSMTAQAETSVYNCAAEACFVQKTPKSLDTLPGNGDSSWSVQVDLPPGTTKVGDIMPPTFRSKGWLDIGPATYLKDIGREPVFTQTRGNFDNAIPHRQGTAVLSCDNSQVEEACVTWPKPAGQAWPTLEVRFQASFQMVGVADEHAQMEGIMESWSYASAKSPLLVRCAPCPPLGQEDIIVYGGNLAYAGEALIDGKTNTIPSSATHAFVRFDDSYPFNNDCGAEGAGCANQPSDYRLFLSHELGHALALTHCDLDFGVMCRITDENGNDGTFGTGFWTPQIREVWALEAMYP